MRTTAGTRGPTDAPGGSESARPTAPRREFAPTRVAPSLRLRAPCASDAALLWEAVCASGTLDPNSPYAYLLLCTDFADTSLVAFWGDELVGFVVGYRPPKRADTLFVWQISVATPARGTGIGGHMLDALVKRAGVRFLEATVTPSNRASAALFHGFARRHAASVSEDCAFERSLFPPDQQHEEELRLRIGPID